MNDKCACEYCTKPIPPVSWGCKQGSCVCLQYEWIDDSGNTLIYLCLNCFNSAEVVDFYNDIENKVK